ncbi:MAG: hypothetical protein ABI807_14095 [Sporichthyaceae bacterium]
MSRARRFLAAAALVLPLLACGGSDSAGGPAAQSPSPSVSASSPSPSSTETYDVPALVDIGGGLHLFVRCSGEGSPVVLLESGDEADQFQWSAVFKQIAEQNRVCAYDRGGNGSSDDATGCRGTPELLSDLTAMLAAVKAEPP